MLLRHLNNALKIPVAIYVAAIGTMVHHAFVRNQPICGHNSYLWAAIGSFTFAMSDLLLAYDKFINPVDVARYGVMILYYSSQIMLTLSTIVDYQNEAIEKPPGNRSNDKDSQVSDSKQAKKVN